MELKLIELLMTEPVVFVALATIVWLLTYLVKKPIKIHTAKIKDDQKKKLVNKWILLIPFLLAFALYFAYNWFITRNWKMNYEVLFGGAFSIAVMAITIYNVFEGLRGKKSEYETDYDGLALYNLLLIYAKDKNKVKLLLDQCKANYTNHDYEISETVKGWLPANVDSDVVNTIVKAIEQYIDATVTGLKKEKGETNGEKIL